MASILYDIGRKLFSEGHLDWEKDNILASLTDQDYVPQAHHTHLSNIPFSSRVPGILELREKTRTGEANVVDAADITFPSVVHTKPIAGIVLYTSNEELILCMQSFPIVTANGDDITICWDRGRHKIAMLGVFQPIKRQSRYYRLLNDVI